MVWMKPRVPAGRAGGGGRLRSQHGAGQGPGSQRHRERPSPSSPLCPRTLPVEAALLGHSQTLTRAPWPLPAAVPVAEPAPAPVPGQTLHAPRVPQNCPLCPARAAGAAGGLTTVLHCRSVTAPTPQCEPHRSMAIPVHPHLPPCVRCTHPTWVKGGD